MSGGAVLASSTWFWLRSFKACGVGSGARVVAAVIQGGGSYGHFFIFFNLLGKMYITGGGFFTTFFKGGLFSFCVQADGVVCCGCLAAHAGTTYWAFTVGLYGGFFFKFAVLMFLGLAFAFL
mmetsp:Transcript_66135/g.193557  ORF Transcript_66135/g.193557 Transcript_66135/m.193557 type:complete len:122 (+) Transcript_66135:71-436(+)